VIDVAGVVLASYKLDYWDEEAIAQWDQEDHGEYYPDSDKRSNPISSWDQKILHNYLNH